MDAPPQAPPLDSRALAETIREIARRARTEEDVRLNVELALKPILARYGIATEAFYEQPITTLRGTGSADAVYGFGIVEYKRPGTIATPRGRDELVRQLAGYLAGQARERAPNKPAEAAKKMIGIGLDGEQILYLRYAASENRARFFQPVSLETQLEFFRSEPLGRAGFQVVGPMPIEAASVDWLLYSLRFFSRRPLEPKGLASVFGPHAGLAAETVGALYSKLAVRPQPRAEVFFRQWDMIFGVIYGQELERGDTAAKELADLYGIVEPANLKRLLFTVHTYYVLLMKLLAAELVSLQRGSWFVSFAAEIEAADDAALRERMGYLEDGGPFRQFNIVNFLEGDFFRWYLDAWDEDLARAVRHMAIALQQFEPATATIDPDATRDLLKKLYQYLLPRRVRHDLGEYYTPDWLAERLIRQTGYDGNPDKRVLDPSCGSGTFLSLCVRKAFDYADQHLVRPDELVAKLLANVVGFDLNPLAVIAARTNFLLSLGTLIRHSRRIEIPVYFCDSILTPAEFAQAGELRLGGRDRLVETSEGTFTFPAAVIEKRTIEIVCALIEESVQVGRTKAQFVEKLRAAVSGLDAHAEGLLAKVFAHIDELNADGRNGIWARFLKNQFAPVFVGRQTFDIVLGNPPWVNWQSLSDSYRDKTWKLWEQYGLFSLAGHAARLGGGKKDLAMLFVYACLDQYVKPGGRLGFVITQTLFKTQGAGDGFRRFQLGDGERFQVLQVDDLSDFQPFEGATNRTAVAVFQKGRETRYPTPYCFWRKKPGASVNLDDDLDAVLGKVATKKWFAEPIVTAEPRSPWLTARPKALAAMRKAVGQSDYRAYAGSCTWANGVYWVDIVARSPAGQVIVRNLSDVGRLESVPGVELAIEPDLLYPLIRGRDVERWRGQSSAFLLNVQDPKSRRGYDPEWLKSELPLTYVYLLKFERLLRRRSGFRKYFCDERGQPTAPFYSLYNIGPYTFSRFKVLWREQSEFLTCAVIDGERVGRRNRAVIPDHKLMFVPTEVEAEAHYLCAMLNSAVSRLIVKSYGVETQTSTHVLHHVRVPTFDAASGTHRRLAELSAAAHERAAAPDAAADKKLEKIEATIDREAAAVFGVTDAELGDVLASLADLRGGDASGFERGAPP